MANAQSEDIPLVSEFSKGHKGTSPLLGLPEAPLDRLPHIKTTVFAALLLIPGLLLLRGGHYAFGSILCSALPAAAMQGHLRKLIGSQRLKVAQGGLLVCLSLVFTLCTNNQLAAVLISLSALLFPLQALPPHQHSARRLLIALGLVSTIFASTPLPATLQEIYGSPALSLTWFAPILCLNLVVEVFQSFELMTNRHRARIRELAKARKSLRASHLNQDEFLANFSREMRSPLNGVVGMSNLLLDSPLDPLQAESTQMIRACAETLQRQLDDMCDSSKLAQGTLSIKLAPFNLQNLVSDTVKDRLSTAQRKGIDLKLHYAPEAPSSFIGDAHRIQQILVNLLENAIKFTQQGSVSVRVNPVETPAGDFDLQMEVSDTGSGIPRAHQHKIFEAFSPQVSHTDSHIARTGLGLAICQGLLQLMGGSIRFQSQEGAGTTFFVALSLEQDLETGEACNQLTKDFPGARALIIEPEWLDREILQRQLSSWKMDVITTQNYSEASRYLLDCTGETAFNLVISNLELGAENAISVAQRLSNDPAFSKTGHIVCSNREASANEHKELQALNTHAVLLKPAKIVRLHHAVRTALAASSYTAPTAEEKSLSLAPVTKAAALPLVQTLNLEGKVILVVDDNPVNLCVATGVLHGFSATTLTASRGQDAIDLILQEKPDLVLMDCEMPGMDGYMATRLVRQQWTEKRLLPIIAFTAKAMSQDRDKCLEAGMDDYLVKPLNTAQLANLMKKYLLDEPASEIEDASPDIQHTLDWSVLQAAAGGDPALALQILNLFVEDMAKRFYEMEGAVGTAKSEAVLKTLYEINTSSQNIGAGEMSDAAQSIIQLVKAGDWHAVGTQQKQLKRALRNLHRETTKSRAASKKAV